VPVDRPAILRNAEKLLRSGKLDQAIAEYLRIVEDQPADWNTANALGDLYVRAAQTDRAIEQFVRIADHLHVEGFLPKAAAVYKKVLKLKPDHEHAMLQAGEIASRQGLVADARALFNTITAKRRARGDERGVAEIAVRLAGLDPNDFEARLSGARTRVSLDDVPGAIADLKALAAYMQEKERPEEALRAVREAAELDPDDVDLRTLLKPPDAVGTASEVVDSDGGDPGRAESLEALARLLGADAEQRDDVASFGGSIAESEPAAGFEIVGLAADAAVAAGDHSAAAAALQEFVTRVPGHIPALARLVEICEAGGLDSPLQSSRAQLTDAYLAVGQGDEARILAEGLVAREPWERANIERFRRALVLIGEDDPDEIIAQRLSGQTPFATSDRTAAPAAVHAVEPAAPVSDEQPPDFELPIGAPPQPPLSVQESVVEQLASVPAGRARTGEVDLSVALEGIRRPSPSAPSETAASPKAARATESVFVSPPDENYQQGLSHYEAGRLDEAIAPLKAASRSPKLRFLAASLVGRIHRDRGEVADAVEWLERAAQAPAPTPDEGHQLLFDLAEALERDGETSRALAICMELQADAGNYRDVAARIDRLAKVRARG
jgi:tetratricopeptide (TPR) repeat protein